MGDADGGEEEYLEQAKESVFVDVAYDTSGKPVYGTQKQTIILVDQQGRVTFVERTLWDERAERVEPGKGDRWFEFDIEDESEAV